MRKRFFFIFILFASYQALAQWNDIVPDSNQKHKYAIGIYGNADFESNCITTTFAYNFQHGSYIDNNLKEQVATDLKSQNRFGYTLDYGIYGILYNDTTKKKKALDLFFAVKHKAYINSSFTADDFNIPFYGNASYAGKTAQLSPFSFSNLSYQQIELGLACANIGKNIELGCGLSFLAGQKYTSITATNASLYTDTYGEYITFNSDAQLQQNDTGSRQFINGYGASLDLYFRMHYKIAGKHGILSVSTSDLGFLWWNKNSLTYRKDTSYTYNGISINSISDLQNAAFNTLNEDSLRKKYFPEAKKSFYTPVPATLKIAANTDLTEKVSLEIGYWYIFNANDIGYGYIQCDKHFNHGWMGSLQLGYGDYAGVNGALKLAKKFKNCKAELTLNHLQGMALPNYYGGAGAYLGYIYFF